MQAVNATYKPKKKAKKKAKRKAKKRVVTRNSILEGILQSMNIRLLHDDCFGIAEVNLKNGKKIVITRHVLHQFMQRAPIHDETINDPENPLDKQGVRYKNIWNECMNIKDEKKFRLNLTDQSEAFIMLIRLIQNSFTAKYRENKYALRRMLSQGNFDDVVASYAGWLFRLEDRHGRLSLITTYYKGCEVPKLYRLQEGFATA